MFSRGMRVLFFLPCLFLSASLWAQLPVEAPEKEQPGRILLLEEAHPKPKTPLFYSVTSNQTIWFGTEAVTSEAKVKVAGIYNPEAETLPRKSLE